MFISDKSRIRAGRIFYTAFMVFCAVFGTVYEFFSHGVISPHMVFSFLIPLFFGLIPYLIAGAVRVQLPGRHICQLYGGGITTFTLGCIMRGVLNIYGTTNTKLILFPITGGIMTAISLLLAAAEFISNMHKDGKLRSGR